MESPDQETTSGALAIDEIVKGMSATPAPVKKTRFVTIKINTGIECKVGDMANFLHDIQFDSVNKSKHFGKYKFNYMVDGNDPGYPFATATILIQEPPAEFSVSFVPNGFYSVWLGDAVVPENQVKNFLDIFNTPRVIDFIISDSV